MNGIKDIVARNHGVCQVRDCYFSWTAKEQEDRKKEVHEQEDRGACRHADDKGGRTLILYESKEEDTSAS